MDTVKCLVTSILQNIFFYVQHRNEIIPLIKHSTESNEPMADGGIVQETCFDTVIIFVFMFGDTSSKEIAHFIMDHILGVRWPAFA